MPHSVDYIGCYSAGDVAEHAETVSLEGTPDNCIYACRKRLFPYAGLSSENECKCGRVRPRGSKREKDYSCNLSCDGDSTKDCGGTTQQSVYHILMKGHGSVWMQWILNNLNGLYLTIWLILALSTPMSKEEKTEWVVSGTEASGSSATYTYGLYAYNGYIRDGRFVSLRFPKAWIQIDLKTTSIVRAVRLWGNNWQHNKLWDRAISPRALRSRTKC